MIKMIIFVIMLLVIAVLFISIAISGAIFLVRCVRHKDNSKVILGMKRKVAIFTMVCVACGGFVWFTQLTVSTPAIRDENGNVVEDSISELRQLTLNGRKEWISIRGNNKENPVLLFLAGGPGGTQMAAVRHDLSELEKNFVVVNWDQPGAGKSYYATDIEDITVNTYLEDGYALSKYLCKTFKQEKIYIVGESWGSALGIFLVDKYPELYHSFVGTGQMVAFVETEIMDYERAMDVARDRGDAKKIAKLEANGSPPYYGTDVTWKSAEYLNYLSSYMSRNPEIQNNQYNTFRDLLSEEYGIIDKVNFIRGIINTFNHAYPQLYEIDLRTDYASLDVPIYFFLGSHDINAPTSLVEDYFEKLKAPKKEIVWFEHSGHSPWINESADFVQELIRLRNEKH